MCQMIISKDNYQYISHHTCSFHTVTMTIFYWEVGTRVDLPTSISRMHQKRCSVTSKAKSWASMSSAGFSCSLSLTLCQTRSCWNPSSHTGRRPRPQGEDRCTCSGQQPTSASTHGSARSFRGFQPSVFASSSWDPRYRRGETSYAVLCLSSRCTETVTDAK